MASEFNYTVIFPAIIGIIAALVTNIFIFEHQFFKEKQRDFLKMQIEELLLPLFIKMKQDIFDFNDIDIPISQEFKIAMDDTDLLKTIKEKLHLANPKLSLLLLEFINNQYLYDKFYSGKPETIKKNILEIKKEVFSEYEQKVKEYQNMKLWWQFWK
jgi:hypothetical protein